MRGFILTSAFAAVALGQSSSVTPQAPSYSNIMTKYTAMTDSRGVITGIPPVQTVDTNMAAQPLPATSIPAQPLPDTSIPALPSGYTVVNMVPAGLPTGLQTITIGNSTITASIDKSTTIVLSSTSAQTSARSGTANPSGSGSGSNSRSSPTATGGAAHMTAAGALVGAAGLMAALL